jgi:iron complex outermembrane recepter protein
VGLTPARLLFFQSTKQVNDDFDPVASPNQAINDASHTDTTTYGGSLQLSLLNDIGKHKNQFTPGLSVDRGDTDFEQFEQEADFTPNRGTVATEDFELETKVNSRNRYYGLYFTDTISLSERLHLTASGRYNRARLAIRDKSGVEPALNGSHTFSRLNPAIGATFDLRPKLNVYLSYNEGLRAPSPIELTCADPLAPCRLPNNFLADPPLDPVVSKTWEGGVRGQLSKDLEWSAALIRGHAPGCALQVCPELGAVRPREQPV